MSKLKLKPSNNTVTNSWYILSIAQQHDRQKFEHNRLDLPTIEKCPAEKKGLAHEIRLCGLEI